MLCTSDKLTPCAGADWLWSADSAQRALHNGMVSGVCPQLPSVNPQKYSNPNPGSFTTMLSALLTARTAASAADSLGELAGGDWWKQRGEIPPPAPPEGILAGVMRDLFAPAPRQTRDYTELMRGYSESKALAQQPNSQGQFHQQTDDSRQSLQQQVQQQEEQDGNGMLNRQLSWTPNSTPSSSTTGQGSSTGSSKGSTNQSNFQQPLLLPRTAPHNSLLGRLALHCLLFGNARAVAALWQCFVSEIRFQFWEERALLPRMPASSGSSSIKGATASAAAAPHSRPAGGISDRPSRSDEGLTGGVVDGQGLGHVQPTEPQGSTPAVALEQARHAAVGGPPAPHLDSCLVHQKLQMLNICIFRRDGRHARRNLSRSRSTGSRWEATNACGSSFTDNISTKPLATSTVEAAAAAGAGAVAVARDAATGAGAGAGAVTAASSVVQDDALTAPSNSGSFKSVSNGDNADNNNGDGDWRTVGSSEAVSNARLQEMSGVIGVIGGNGGNPAVPGGHLQGLTGVARGVDSGALSRMDTAGSSGFMSATGNDDEDDDGDSLAYGVGMEILEGQARQPQQQQQEQQQQQQLLPSQASSSDNIASEIDTQPDVGVILPANVATEEGVSLLSVPQGVQEAWQGHYLLQQPDVVINIPITQVRGCHSLDCLIVANHYIFKCLMILNKCA